ncbi:hypothetical protein CRUP_037891, partial [Coryphaenoides rupestris]
MTMARPTGREEEEVLVKDCSLFQREEEEEEEVLVKDCSLFQREEEEEEEREEEEAPGPRGCSFLPLPCVWGSSPASGFTQGAATQKAAQTAK